MRTVWVTCARAAVKMAESKPKAKPKEKKTVLPWGMSGEALKPNTIKAIPQTKLKAFSLGRTNPMKKANPFMKKKEEREEKKKIEAKEAAEVYEQFLASFEGSSKAGKTFVRGSTTIDPSSGSERPASPIQSQKFYKPSSKYISKMEEKESKPEIKLPPPVTAKPEKKKGTEKKLSFLELFREELKRSQEERKKRHSAKEEGSIPLNAPDPDATSEIFKVDEYRDFMKGSFDTGDPLTTNLYVGNINPKMNEEMLCQIYGKFGPLASVKVMWPRTEEERARNRNCGFVAYMNRADAEKALEATRGSTIMEFDIQVGWGKAVPLPPQPIYIPPDMQEEENAKVPDPPSGLPFNAQSRKKKSGGSGPYGSVPPPGGKDEGEENFEDLLYNSLVRVVIPTDIELLMLIHRMIEFVIREGPMFEAMIMNKELSNPTFQFLFDNQSPAHIYYRWKLFSILNGDSPETWRIEEFRMFEAGSLWKPPPLKNLRAKVMPPIVEEVVKKGQLSAKNRDDLEDQLRGISMERAKIKGSMVWCLDHAESAEEIVECVSEALCIDETPLPMKIARLYLVTDILQNCSSSIPNASNFRRGFEGRLVAIVEHFHTVLKGISSRMRAASFKRRVLVCMRAWNQSSVYHFHLIDKLRETFIGKTHEELEKQKAFETVAALIGVPEKEVGDDSINRMPILLENKPIDFSRGGNIDGIPMEGDLDGEPLGEADIDGVPLSKEEDLDGVPMEEEPSQPTPVTSAATAAPVRSKWELVDYGDDSDDKEDENDKSPSSQGGGASTGLSDKQKQQLLAELDERKRKILREVELKVVELSDALEASGSYNKSEIQERVSKYRDKLMQEAVEPKRTSKLESGGSGKSKTKRRRSQSRSPSPSTLAKYDLDESPHRSRSSPRRSQKRSRSRSTERDRSSSAKKRKSSSSPKRSRSRSPRRSKSRSPARKRSKSRSPARKRSKSRSPARKRSKSRSPARKRSKSRSPARKRSKSRSPARKRSRSPARKRSKSRSPSRKRSKSRSPTRKCSRSPGRKRSRSPGRKRSRSRSPGRKRSRSPTRKRSKSPNKRRSRSPTRKRSRSRSRGRKRSRSKSPTRKKSRSRSPRKRRSRSRSPKHSSSSKHRSRSRSPRSRRYRSRSRSPKSSSKKSKRRSRSRSKSPHKSSKSSSKKSKH